MPDLKNPVRMVSELLQKTLADLVRVRFTTVPITSSRTEPVLVFVPVPSVPVPTVLVPNRFQFIPVHGPAVRAGSSRRS